MVNRAQNGPGNLAKGWKYNLYTAVTRMYDTKSPALTAATCGYDTPSTIPMMAMAAVEGRWK